MQRREFMAGLGGAAAWPVVAARAQQPAMPVRASVPYRWTGTRHGRSWIGVLLGVAMLAACSEPAAPKLSKEDEQVLDAMMFLFSGIEDNTKDECKLFAHA